MAIKITVGDDAAEQERPNPVVASVELQIRRSMNGDYYISDHNDIDIIILKDKQKLLVIAKDLMSELVYGAQDRLFKFLVRKGLVAPDSIQGGSVYGSMEGQLMTSEEFDPIKMSIINLSKWIDEERPYFEFAERYDEMESDRFVDPEEEESTELGEVPHGEMKGVLRPGYNYGPYWLSYSY
jgi:hypothetical protein